MGAVASAGVLCLPCTSVMAIEGVLDVWMQQLGVWPWDGILGVDGRRKLGQQGSGVVWPGWRISGRNAILDGLELSKEVGRV